MRVLIAGASGFIGTALIARLAEEGHDVVRLVRRRAQGPDEVSWSPAAGIIDFTVMDRVDAVVNLSGASLARLPWRRVTWTGRSGLRGMGKVSGAARRATRWKRHNLSAGRLPAGVRR